MWKFAGRYNGTPDLRPADQQRRVDVLGVSQFLVQNGRIVREVRLYDEIALRTQIDSTRGDGRIVTANIY